MYLSLTGDTNVDVVRHLLSEYVGSQAAIVSAVLELEGAEVQLCPLADNRTPSAPEPGVGRWGVGIAAARQVDRTAQLDLTRGLN